METMTQRQRQFLALPILLFLAPLLRTGKATQREKA